MKEIELTQGHTTLVDDIDYDYLNQWKWYAKWNYNAYYTACGIWDGLKVKTTYMHRIILERIIGRILTKNETVDHINHNTLDNRRENLRLATPGQNVVNRRKQVNNTSGYKGVTWNKQAQKWQAQIWNKGVRFHLGYFDTAEDAYNAYCKAADELHGKFANYG